jgi:putative transposase
VPLEIKNFKEVKMTFLLRIVVLAQDIQYLFYRYRSYSELLFEIAVLRQQLAVLKRQTPRPQLTRSDRLFWIVLRRFWKKWQEALIIVKPETVISWHRKGFRLYWKYRSRNRKSKGKLPITKELKKLIRQMAYENPTWGAPRIHGELLKLGFSVSERTISRYLSKPGLTPNRKKGTKWNSFVKNQSKGFAAMDFFVVPTLLFNNLYCFFIIRHERRRILHFNVTFHPTAQWVAKQLREAFKGNSSITFMIYDRDSIFSLLIRETLKGLGIESRRTSYRSPWQNGVAERWVGSCRRELLDHVIILNKNHLLRLLEEYVEYYHHDRTHYHLDKDPPMGRPVLKRESDNEKVIALPRIGGLHHKYIRHSKKAA